MCGPRFYVVAGTPVYIHTLRNLRLKTIAVFFFHTTKISDLDKISEEASKQVVVERNESTASSLKALASPAFVFMETPFSPHSIRRSASMSTSIGPKHSSLWEKMCCSMCFQNVPRQTRDISDYTHEDQDHPDQSSHRSPQEIQFNQSLKAQVEYYSTMRVHMKRVQLCLEQEKRNKFYKELVIYSIFLFFVIWALISLPIHYPYEQNAAIYDLYFDEEFPNVEIKKTFHDIMVEQELWQWVEGPLLNGFYDLPLRNTRRLSSLMFRTGRVNGVFCRDLTQADDDVIFFPDEICYSFFTKKNEMKEPYGNSSSSILEQEYLWQNDLSTLLRSQTFNPSVFNHEMDYGKGGYVVYLPRDNEKKGREIIQQLKKDFLLDNTRYLAVNFFFFNQRSNLFTYVQALIEMSYTDYYETTSRVKSFRIYPSFQSFDFLKQNILILVMILATIWLISRELMDLKENGFKKYFHSMWNFLDILQVLLLVIFIEKWITYLILSGKKRDFLRSIALMDCSTLNQKQQESKCYIDVETLAWLFGEIDNYASLVALISIGIVFKYLRLNSRLNLLWRTLRFAAKDLIAFVVIFFIIFLGFAVMGFFIFGSKTRQYHSLSVSLTSCFQMLLGAFDYNEMHRANPAMSAVFFFSFMISIYLVCVNMFIAIMSEYYSVAQKEKKKNEEHKRELLENNSKGGNGNKMEDFIDSLQFVDVEYDIIKQIQNYMRGLRVSFKLPPQPKEAKSMQSLPIAGDQRVLLVDFKYLLAERRRLKRKFRACVHVITTCTGLIKQVQPESTISLEQEDVPEHRSLKYGTIVSNTPSVHSLNGEEVEYVDFPVTYLPIVSTAADPVALLKTLKPGMRLQLDDGSLTKDQITLEVLGAQDCYLPKCLRKNRMNRDKKARSEQLDLQIEEEIASDDKYFGLTHNYGDGSDSSHIRACRVLYNGETVLDGMETCTLPNSAWIRYFLGTILWESIVDFFNIKTKRKKRQQRKQRLLNDGEIELLIMQHFNVPGRGISCRFDELVRNFRMFIAKKVHRRNRRVDDLEQRILLEIITFLERFPSALTPLDKREHEGYKYVPQPVDTSKVRLPNSIHRLTELLSQNAHEVWAQGRIQQGWKWGSKRDNDLKLHPDLVPYEDLTEEDKQYDRDTSMSALKVITALGFILEPGTQSENFNIEFGTKATEKGGTYVPKPIPTDDVKVPPQLKSVIELLAENTHEVWAQMRMSQGWKYGPQRDDAKREHNGLVPYIYLTNDEKQMDRNTAVQTVKLILRCGFTFVHKDKVRGDRQKNLFSGSSRGGTFRVFGRNENPESKNVSDAVTLARSTSKAARAFLRGSSNQSSRRFFLPSTSSTTIMHTSNDMERGNSQSSLSTPPFNGVSDVNNSPIRYKKN